MGGFIGLSAVLRFLRLVGLYRAPKRKNTFNSLEDMDKDGCRSQQGPSEPVGSGRVSQASLCDSKKAFACVVSGVDSEHDETSSDSSWALRATISQLRSRGRGPWGGCKLLLDRGSQRLLGSSNMSSIPTRSRLLSGNRYWRMRSQYMNLSGPGFFKTSYRYRGHEGCVNAIK